MFKKYIFSTLFILGFVATTQAQTPTSSEIYGKLKKFASLKRVLYVAAHPDDENTRFLAWVSLSEHAETAYFSLTRGDGGQNLIGNELGADLGVLRTQELLAARSFDGAQQYFSRAVDFGYSKSADESFDKWGKEELLADAVLMIRQFQPDVIITRFPPDERAGHGHHTASALIAIEAFEKAADPNFLPEQVKKYGAWKASAVYWNASNWWNKNLDAEARNNPDYLIKDIGGYSSILGKSYNEIGTIARSQHKCQGFGDILERGTRLEYFQYLAGDKLKKDFFEQNPQDWTKKVSASFEKKLQGLISDFDFVNVQTNASRLLALYNELAQLPESVFKQTKMRQCSELIADCLGLYMEIQSPDYTIAQGEEALLKLSIINRSTIPVSIRILNRRYINKTLPGNEVISEEIECTNSKDISTPYWLTLPATDLFQVPDKALLLAAQNEPTFSFALELEVDGTVLTFQVPVRYKWRDPSYGERSRETISVPDYSVNFSEQSIILQSGQSKRIVLDIHSFKEGLTDTIYVHAPQHWVTSETVIPINIAAKHAHQKIELKLEVADAGKRGELTLKNAKGETVYSYTEIEYDHIPTQSIFRPASLNCVKIDAQIKPGKVAYIKGVDDAVPQAIEQLGFEVKVFEVDDLASLDLSTYQSVVLGIRIYNVHPELSNYDSKLFEYVTRGGNLIMQYNTASRSETAKKFGGEIPFELSSKRVTEEDAEVTFLHPDHPILNSPNQLTKKDFEDWVQERGLYFATNWDEQYQALFAWNDSGEEPLQGALITANYGRGRFVYTGISFFRELPEGVEGAYRLFANLLSYEPTTK